MKIKFTKLPTTTGTIKVSLDGGQSFTDYNIADIHESGITLGDDQDYEKIQIQAPANVLKNLNVVSSVKVDDGSGSSDVDLSDYVKKEYFYGELYDGGCGYGYRITSRPGGFERIDTGWYENLVLSDGRSLGDLCEYDGEGLQFSGDKPTGRLYAVVDKYGSKSEYYLLPTQYYLK